MAKTKLFTQARATATATAIVNLGIVPPLFSACPRFYGNLIGWQFLCKLLQVCLLSRRLI